MINIRQDASAARSLLLVEDDAAARTSAAEALRLVFPSLVLHQAENGKEGVQLYQQYRPDIVLTDISMPVLDGITMVQQILAMAPRAHIIVISGHTDTCCLLKSIKLGVRHYILKPLEHKVLFEAVSDCLQRVELERQVCEQEQYIRLLSEVVEQNSSLIAIADRSGDLVYVNPKFTSFTGYDEQEVLQWHLRQLHFRDAPQGEFDAIWSRLSAGEEWRGEGLNRKKDGEIYQESASIAPITDRQGEIRHFVTMRDDVTQKKRSQEELNRAQRLESLGVLAGGIAHDFNNILTAVLGNIAVAQSVGREGKELTAALEEAEKAAQRAKELTRQLLTFSRGGSPAKKKVSVRHLVEESVSFSLRGTSIQSRLSIPETVEGVEVDEGQMRQAFNNILINAVQAMPGGGRVTVQAENVGLPPGNGLGLPHGSYVRVAFADEGHGVAEDIEGRIFDPYFSTRTGGSGMGLASAHSIMARHGGHIGLERACSGGATFLCHLPSTGSPYAEGVRRLERCQQEPPGGGESVLVMDDDGSILKVARKMLHCLGYQVDTCSNGIDAIRLYTKGRKAGTPYLAVIMDLTVVGGMGGREAADHILALDPQAKLIVSSGYYDDPVLADFRDYGFCSVLPKPYRLADLAEVLGSVRADAAL